MSVLRQFGLVAWVVVETISAQVWVGQGKICDFDTASSMPSIAFDNSCRAWCAWHGYWGGYSLMYSRWLGDRWDEGRGVIPDTLSVIANFGPQMAFHEIGLKWLVWYIQCADNSSNIGSSYWVDSCWSPEIQVNLPDSTELDFRPKVASGGGKVWCVWFGGPTDYPPLYKIYASRWDEELGQWEPEMEVSEQGNWFPDVAVDTLGRPHIVWCSVSKYAVYYSYFDGDSWSHPVIIHDTTRVTASPRAYPRIEIDREEILHTCFTGAYRGASHRDIFYTRNDGSGWDTCQLVTRDAVYDEWCSDIAADRPDNVWVVWDRQGEGPDQFRVYASRYDGKEWLPEERIDNDSAYYDGGPAIALDALSYPWVVWTGITYNPRGLEAFYNRYTSMSISEHTLETGKEIMLSGSTPAKGGIKLRYRLPAPALVTLTVFDGAGREILKRILLDKENHWETSELNLLLPSGVYLCRITGAEHIVTQKFVVVSH